MAKRQIIPPFPPDIDRQFFAAYLCGMTDSEGSFVLAIDRRSNGQPEKAYAAFRITLRADDQEIIRLIQSYFGCGTIRGRIKRTQPNSKPQICFDICGIKEQMLVVVPHFERYPLLAKKKRDFEIWKEGVRLLYAHRLRPTLHRKGWAKGTKRKYTDSLILEITALKEHLSMIRKYNSDQLVLILYERPTQTEFQGSLFS